MNADSTRTDLIGFVALAYAISWLVLAPLVAAGLGWIDPLPEVLHLLGAAGPLGSALWLSHRSGRLRNLVRSAVVEPPSPRWIAVAVGSPLLLLAGGMGLAALAGGTGALSDGDTFRGGGLAAVLVTSVCYGFGEEVGWRGFALPRLQAARPAWSATVILAAIWAVWHTPMFFYRFSFEGPATLAGFFVSMLAGAFWLTFLYNSSGGSIMAVALWHTVWNVVNQLAADAEEVVIALNVLMMVLGFGVLLTGPRELSTRGRRKTE